ncbi:MAG: hypothetical protein KatS3mg055_1243 [Chloroflexus sp.]|uniref:hypothetical protein n=1 Tax=Chloroflexus sp. TaxID=1904827 RepID=UPI0021DD6D88|nr:hypothetical protein [Chloroflexus sp.]GIV88725.1 MAG: hypothetical protein KatS3mg055_1243 [Chloroflexus sp.]
MKHLFLLIALIGLLSNLSTPTTLALAETPATFISLNPIVQPLTPTPVVARISGYHGPASLIIFDGRGRFAGVFNLTIVNGEGWGEVIPRGALGNHWAALFTADGQMVANGTIYRLDAETTLRTGIDSYDRLYPTVRRFMAADRLSYQLDGQEVVGYRSPDSPLLWLRDHYYQNRAFRYFETDLRSLPEAFARAQAPDGSLPDFVARPEWAIPAFRTPVEADVEYLFVQLIYETWQVTGDTEWMLRMLPAAQRAIDYTLRDPLRWEPTLGLVKRPFTIDTWDYEYGPAMVNPNTGELGPRHWIDEQTRWGIFHGDNTGLAAALNALALMEEAAGQADLAAVRRTIAADLMTRLNALSWNGRFYTHHVKLIPYDVPGVDEAEQLSLSNAIALNRGILTETQGRAIVAEYLRRLNDPRRIAFAEWYSIDPPFPVGAFDMNGRLGERPGEYVNGGIMPLVGGELARGAFRYGYEAYGFNILQRYINLIERTGASYLWYYPTGGIAPANEFLPTDGWGASAMLGAFIEGATGIEDQHTSFTTVTISPRWPADPVYTIHDVYVVARYAAGDGYVAYRWQLTPATDNQPSQINLTATGNGDSFRLRLLVPAGMTPQTVHLNGAPIPLQIEQIGSSRYVTITAAGPIITVTVTLARG